MSESIYTCKEFSFLLRFLQSEYTCVGQGQDRKMLLDGKRGTEILSKEVSKAWKDREREREVELARDP